MRSGTIVKRIANAAASPGSAWTEAKTAHPLEVQNRVALPGAICSQAMQVSIDRHAEA